MMEEEDVREVYDKRYASFSFFPGYRHEALTCTRLLGVIQSKGFKFENSEANLIDLGCGFGMKTHALARKFRQVTGLDISNNAIRVAELLNDTDNLHFVASDAKDFEVTEPFSRITAFGYSGFNLPGVEDIVKHIEEIQAKFLDQKGMLVLYSRSDFSGKAPSGWYYHTRNELNLLVTSLRKTYPKSRVELIFPHRTWKNFRCGNFAEQLTEWSKWLVLKQKEYLIVIDHAER